MRQVKVLLRGSFYLSSNWGISGNDNIKLTLERQGWNISSVDILSYVLYPTQPLDFIITANVHDHITDNDVTSVLYTALSPIMTVMSASLLSGFQAARLSNQIVYSTNAANVPDSSLLDSLTGGAVGISTGMAIGVAVLILVIALRK